MTTDQAPLDDAARLHENYRPHLDAVRGVAIAAVMLFHAEFRLFPGGALGVDAFFMLSAYLITTLLCRERTKRGAVDLSAFYYRRLFRLMPALLLFTFLVGL